MNENQEKSAGCIVFHKSEAGYVRFLVVRDVAHGNWGFPKGHLEQGETEQEAALRETKEEVGLEVELIDGFRKEIEYTMANGKKKTAVYFLAKANTTDIDYSECNEIDNHAWLTPYEALGRVTFVNAAMFIQDARTFLKEKGIA